MSRVKLIAILLSAILLTACTPAGPETTPSDYQTRAQTEESTLSPTETSPFISDSTTMSAETTTQPATSFEESTPAEIEPALSGRAYRDVLLKFHEPWDYVYILSQAEEALVGENRYCFKPDIDPQLREEFILAQEELLILIAPTEPVAYILTDDYRDRADSEAGAGFYLTSSIRSWRQILTTLQLIEGDDANYGWLYARAQKLAQLLDWEKDEPKELPEDTIRQCFQEDPGRLNLYYPCFLESFSTEEQILSAKALACMSIGGEEDISEELFFSRIAETAAGWDIHFEPSYLRFKDGGKSSPLVVYTKYLEELLLEEFTRDVSLFKAEAWLERERGQGIPAHLDWQKSITELIRVHELIDEMIVDFQALLHCEKEGPVKVVFEAWDPEEKVIWNYYIPGERAIYAYTMPVILHEYIHWLHYHLTNIPNYLVVSWQAEVLATYFGFRLTQDYYDRMEEVFGVRNTAQTVYVDWFYEMHLERGIEPLEWLNVDPSNPNRESYPAYYVIGAYLAETYGEEAFANMIVYPEKVEEISGKTMDEIMEDWGRYVEEQAAAYAALGPDSTEE